MKDVCFVSVCFGDPRYFEQMDRLKESILSFYPEANILFFRGHYPAGASTFFDSLYGFKVDAIKAAKEKGFNKIVWLDPAMIMVDKIDDLLKFEMMAVQDDNVLYNVVADKCYKHFKITKDFVEYSKWHLVGGSIYYFDFNTVAARNIFEEWFIAEKLGMFGSQTEQASEQLQGHRMDEAVIAICMYLHGVKPTSADDARYCWAANPMFIKKHFK